ncbi:MAG: hypothetical protein M5U25_13685 [Planctomycetota bacterium]|nr:hypothetical protein [Planctomycetota bacterium]
MKQPESYDELAINFELQLYELGRALYPQSRRVLDGLVTTYSAAGRHEEALAASLKLLALEPENPRYHYNYACGLCCVGQRDDALAALQHAISLGFSDYEYLTADPDLAPCATAPSSASTRRRPWCSAASG